jgi:multiple sugar transport system substrate-binding protein
MKKWLMLLLSVVFVFGLAACSNDDAEGTGSDSNDDPSNDQGTDSSEVVELTIASWGFGTEGDENLNRLMVDAFNEQHENINVTIDESIDPADWNGSLAAAASGGVMPDVFMLAQIPTGLANDWLYDISAIAKADDDFSQVPEAVVDAVTYDEGIYALPAGQHLLGYFVNKDIFEEQNLDAPAMGVSIDGFVEAIRNVTDVNDGRVGLNHPYTIPDWYPISANQDMGWFTYLDGSFQLDSNEFISGVNLGQDMLTNGYAYETLSEDQKANFNGENPEEVWLNGQIGIKWDGTWITGHLDSQSDFEWDFIGIPGERVVMTHDYYGISSATEHPEEAYELAKWMSFSSEGFLKQIEIADASENLNLASMPVTANQEVLDAYFERFDAPGLRQAYENIDEAVVEPVKTVPGYNLARWDAPTGVEVGDNPNVNMAGLVDAAVRGNLNIQDYVSQMNELANKQYQEGQAAIQ